MSSGSTMALCLFASGNAQAINIIVDPGTVGSSFQDQIIVSKSIVKYRQTEFHFRNSLLFYFERLILLG
jgi:hypothetical protein